MKNTALRLALGGAFATAAIAPAYAQTRTPWQMHDGIEVTTTNPLGLLRFSCAPERHGAICEYDVVPGIAPADDPGWRPAPNGETVGLNVGCGGSRVCSAPIGCLAYGDFTYFQTFVDIPANVNVTQFTITMFGMDDGARISIFNSNFPNGTVVDGSYVFLGGSGTSNLANLVVSGERNRVVITQVDDCCCENHLDTARVVLNGQVVQTGCSVTGCDDGNACTTDTCNPDGSCSHTAVSCDDGNACTEDTCAAATGCAHREQVCDDGNGCTTDSCNPASGLCEFVDQCPNCSRASATVATIWPPNHKMVEVGVQGVTDPQGQTTAIYINGVGQDEVTNGQGDGDACPDAVAGGTTAQVRAERGGTKKSPGDGRVYHIAFTATDPDGYMCTGTVTTCVPHDQGHPECVDQGALYDSAVCQ